MKKIAIISDTHGYLEPKLFKLLGGHDLILHAGDVGSMDIVSELSTITEVKAVYGNMDDHNIRLKLKEELSLEIEDFKVYLSHKKTPKNGSFDIVISGHSHKAEIYHYKNTVYINPGSANPSLSKPLNKASLVSLNLEQNLILSSNIVFF